MAVVHVKDHITASTLVYIPTLEPSGAHCPDNIKGLLTEEAINGLEIMS